MEEATIVEDKEEEDRFKIPGLKSLFAQAVTFKEPTHWDHGSAEEADDFLEPDDEPAVAAPEANVATSATPEAAQHSEASPPSPREEDEYLEPEDEPNPATKDSSESGPESTKPSDYRTESDPRPQGSVRDKSTAHRNE